MDLTPTSPEKCGIDGLPKHVALVDFIAECYRQLAVASGKQAAEFMLDGHGANMMHKDGSIRERVGPKSNLHLSIPSYIDERKSKAGRVYYLGLLLARGLTLGIYMRKILGIESSVGEGFDTEKPFGLVAQRDCWNEEEKIRRRKEAKLAWSGRDGPVSYTHLTLPTIYSV